MQIQSKTCPRVKSAILHTDITADLYDQFGKHLYYRTIKLSLFSDNYY